MIPGKVEAADRAAVSAARRRASPTVFCAIPGGEAAQAAAAPAAAWADFDHHFVASPAAEDHLRAAGVDAARITALPAESGPRCAAFMAVIARLLAQDLKLIRSKQRP